MTRYQKSLLSIIIFLFNGLLTIHMMQLETTSVQFLVCAFLVVINIGILVVLVKRIREDDLREKRHNIDKTVKLRDAARVSRRKNKKETPLIIGRTYHCIYNDNEQEKIIYGKIRNIFEDKGRRKVILMHDGINMKYISQNDIINLTIIDKK